MKKSYQNLVQRRPNSTSPTKRPMMRSSAQHLEKAGGGSSHVRPRWIPVMAWACDLRDANQAHISSAAGACKATRRLCRSEAPASGVCCRNSARILSFAGQLRAAWKPRLGKRLDRLTRQVERLERHVTISNEAMALFVRFWLTATSPVPDAALPAAQAKGRERYRAVYRSAGTKAGEGAEPGAGIVPRCRAARRNNQTTGSSLIRRPFLSFSTPDYARHHRPVENKADEVLLLFRWEMMI